jgi:hypothetical protein
VNVVHPVQSSGGIDQPVDSRLGSREKRLLIQTDSSPNSMILVTSGTGRASFLFAYARPHFMSHAALAFSIRLRREQFPWSRLKHQFC